MPYSHVQLDMSLIRLQGPPQIKLTDSFSCLVLWSEKVFYLWFILSTHKKSQTNQYQVMSSYWSSLRGLKVVRMDTYILIAVTKIGSSTSTCHSFLWTIRNAWKLQQYVDIKLLPILSHLATSILTRNCRHKTLADRETRTRLWSMSSGEERCSLHLSMGNNSSHPLLTSCLQKINSIFDQFTYGTIRLSTTSCI